MRKVGKIRAVLLCGVGLSLVIETLQYIFGIGVSELDDLAFNTLGVWIGAVTVQRYWYRQRGKNRKLEDR